MAYKILVVDDEVAIREGVTRILQSANYVVETASSGNQAKLRLVELPLPQLVVLDVLMPDCDGIEVCRQVRFLPTYIPVLMLSARDSITDKIIGLEVGADDYLAKPFDPRELIARIQALIRHNQSTRTVEPQETSLSYGPICIWPERHQLEVHGNSVDIPAKEWALLALLIQHPNRVFGREMLLRNVWGYDYLGDSRTVDVHIQRLRARLATYQVDTYIQTVRGFGYRFVPQLISSV